MCTESKNPNRSPRSPISKKKAPNEPQAVFDMMDKAMTKIRTIDMSAWTDDNKTNFQTSLTSLKTETDNYLNTPPPFPKRPSIYRRIYGIVAAST